MRRSRAVALSVAAALAVAGTMLWIATRASRPDSTAPTAQPTAGQTSVPPRSDVLSFTVTNNSGRNEPVYLYVLGQDLHPGGKLGYVTEAGTFTGWTGGQAVPAAAPDVAITGPANGSSKTIKLPRQLSGRMYFAFGKKLDLRLSEGGLVQPAPWAAGDPNKDTLFDWSEFTFNDGGLWLNSSQVDQFAVPHVVSVTAPDGKTSKTGETVPGGRNKVIEAIRAQPGFEKTVYARSDGTVLRVLAPGKATEAGLMSPTYLDPYITEAWSAYRSKTLTVVPFTDQPDMKFAGRTTGDVLTFTDASGKKVTSFSKPSASEVWGCDGTLDAPNDKVVGPIARTLCAALNRSTLGRLDTQPSGTAKDFYQGSLSNHYSRIIHENMVDHRAYGFAFDDVQNQESLVHDTDPRLAGVVLSPLN
jgi:hypothetical protein